MKAEGIKIVSKHRTTRRDFLRILGAGAAALALPQWLKAEARAKQRPNIVFIMADDLGYGDLGCYEQQKIQSPNIDRLAAEGMRFTQAYAGSTVCAPSRCSLMTGMHNGHNRIRDNIQHEIWLRPDDLTVALYIKMGFLEEGRRIREIKIADSKYIDEILMCRFVDV